MSIGDAVAAASAYLAEHPDDARYRDSAARAHLTSGLTVEVTGPGGERMTTDMPRGIGGTAAAPSPGWMLRAAAAACVASLIAIRAAATQVEIRSIDVEVDSESDDRGILGLDPSVPAGAISMRVVVSVGAPALDKAAKESLVAWAVEHCPVTDSIARAVPLSIEVDAQDRPSAER
jgi:uncharacterized OsmC-like protein